MQRPFIVAVKYFGGGEPTHRSYAAKSNYAQAPISDEGIQVILGAVEAAHRESRLAATGILLSGQGGEINRVDRDATAFFHRDALFFIRYTAFWDPNGAPGTASANLEWVRRAYDAMRPHVSGGAVVNYVDPGLTDWGAAYYGSHLRRLVNVKRRYDPGNLFRFAQSIPTRL